MPVFSRVIRLRERRGNHSVHAMRSVRSNGSLNWSRFTPLRPQKTASGVGNHWPASHDSRGRSSPLEETDCTRMPTRPVTVAHIETVSGDSRRLPGEDPGLPSSRRLQGRGRRGARDRRAPATGRMVLPVALRGHALLLVSFKEWPTAGTALLVTRDARFRVSVYSAREEGVEARRLSTPVLHLQYSPFS